MTFGFAQEIALTQLRCAAPFALRKVWSLGERAGRCGTLSFSLVLKALRGAIATAQKQAAYVIFPDRTLIEIASAGQAALTNWPAFMASARSSCKNTGQPFCRDPGASRRLNRPGFKA